jgi:hypothetical protein
MREGCVLLYKAQELARERGLEPSTLTCVLRAICDGRRCGLVERDRAKIEQKWRMKKKGVK